MHIEVGSLVELTETAKTKEWVSKMPPNKEYRVISSSPDRDYIDIRDDDTLKTYRTLVSNVLCIDQVPLFHL